MTNLPALTERELEIMKVVWDLEQASVRQVHKELSGQPRDIAYTTVMTQMKILEEKGHLSRRTEGRAHIYTPTQTQSTAVTEMVRRFVSRVFDGATEPLLLALVRDQKLSEDDLERVRRLIADEDAS